MLREQFFLSQACAACTLYMQRMPCTLLPKFTLRTMYLTHAHSVVAALRKKYHAYRFISSSYHQAAGQGAKKVGGQICQRIHLRNNRFFYGQICIVKY
jgi:hypothetical protein